MQISYSNIGVNYNCNRDHVKRFISKQSLHSTKENTGRPKSLATRDPQKLKTKMSKNAFYFWLGTRRRLPASNFHHMLTLSKALF